MLKIADLVYVDGRAGKVIQVYPNKKTYDIQLVKSRSIIEYPETKVKRRYLHCIECNRLLRGRPMDKLCKSCRKDVK